MTSNHSLAAAARHAALAAAFVAVLAPAVPAHAETGAGTALKNTAIAGSVATWAVALFNGAPIGDCLVQGNSNGPGGEWGLRLQGGSDAELKYGMVAAERRNCALTNALGWSLDVSPVVGLSYWDADSGSLYAHHAWDLAYVPMMHWRHPVAAQTNVDVEFGIGPAYLSEANIGDRQKSTNFQFSDHFGVGLGSSDGKWRVGFEFRHISNLSIQTPNAAVDYKGIAISYRP
jgi:lipid A 3-O-deacylase